MVQIEADYACVKLIDFGLACMSKESDHQGIEGIALMDRKGTIDFMAAESFTDFSHTYRLRPSHDMFALGVILVNIICAVRHQELRHPFLTLDQGVCPLDPGYSARFLGHNYEDKVLWHAEYFAGEPHTLIELTASMLVYDPMERITADRIMANEWMQEVDAI